MGQRGLSDSPQRGHRLTAAPEYDKQNNPFASEFTIGSSGRPIGVSEDTLPKKGGEADGSLALHQGGFLGLSEAASGAKVPFDPLMLPKEGVGGTLRSRWPLEAVPA